MRILYRSGEIAACIKELFQDSSASGRRVALVAYVGKDYAKFLPNPRGINLVCNPTPGATSALAICELQSSGADVQFSDKLHMKVYWSEKKGCVITSANLSQSALGIKGLKEAGVLIEPNIVDVDELLKSAKPGQVTEKKLKQLKDEEERLKDSLARAKRNWMDRNNFFYVDWFRLPSPVRQNWKFGWYREECDSSEAARSATLYEYGIRKPRRHLQIGDGEAAQGEWLLQFRISGQTVTHGRMDVC